ncbi:MAG: hypothetical protein KAQ90_03210 [Melioribacteraceae bacterium]|nr:hypothetical protein [Melioribacteraceae bacterium]
MSFNTGLILSISILLSVAIYGQDENAIEIFVIDSYITPEKPHKLILSFFTSDSTTSQVIIDEKYEFDVSTILMEDHYFETEISSLRFDSTVVPFKIIAIGKNGFETFSETFDIYLPYEYELIKNDNSSLLNVCVGGLIFLFPSTIYVVDNGNDFFSLSKELPIISFYSGGYNYPFGYISLEYAYIFNSGASNYLRLGYKQIIQTKLIEYISPGINLTTNFLGFNGISPELSFGLFKFYDVFTFYARYRYNFDLPAGSNNFHEFSIGLFTAVLSISK